MLPTQSNPTKPRVDRRTKHEYWARAPYNFVPLPEKVIVVEDKIPDQDRYSDFTGYIQCNITTESPLYTRCELTPEDFGTNGEKSFNELSEEKKNNYAQFFGTRCGGMPIIPGSSLRGMIRALVEIISFSKIQWVSSNKLVYRMVGDTTSLGTLYRDRMKPKNIFAGYMHNQRNKWQIIPAKLINGRPFGRVDDGQVRTLRLVQWKDCRNAFEIFGVFDTNDDERSPLATSISNEPRKNYEQMVLVKTGQIPGKKKHFLFGMPNTAAPIEVSEQMIDIYRDQVTQGQISLLGNKEGVLHEMQPVFYLREGDTLTFFGHTMMFRLPYDKTPFDFIPEFLHDNRTGSDITERIFGFIRDKGKDSDRARSGRVFFTDAKIISDSDDIWLSSDLITPQILGSPKPTTFQHYLVQDKGRDHDPDDKAQLAHYGTPTPKKTVIRGHKLYWHKGSVSIESFREDDQDKIRRASSQYTRIRPVKAGVSFSFRIYFENLREWELGALLWALKLPGKDGVTCRHKLGMGKPLGMGSVHLVPELHLADRPSRYKRLFDGDHWYEGDPLDANSENFLNAFEKLILQQMDQSERNKAENLSAIPRIQMLLKMLEWPGPDPKLTRYMQITPENEYKERPVLPNPFGINAPATQSRSSQKPTKYDSSTPPNPDHDSQMEKSRSQASPDKQDARNKVDPYIVAIKDILEIEYPPDLSSLAKKIALKWPVDRYQKLGFKKFKQAVEHTIAEFNLGHIINQDTTITYSKKGDTKQSSKYK